MEDGQYKIEWIPGFEGLYKVSTEGEVFSYVVGKGGERVHGSIGRGGYRRVQLSKDGEVFTLLLHRLVLRTYMGPPTPGQQGLHKDDSHKDDNSVRNLIWGSHQDNMDSGHLNDIFPKGEDHHNAKLTDPEVEAILEEYALGRWVHPENVSQSSLAFEYRVNVLTMAKILKCEEWYPRCKLSREQFEEAKARYANRGKVLVPTREPSQQGLARKYGVTQTTIQIILSGKTWKHIDRGVHTPY